MAGPPSSEPGPGPGPAGPSRDPLVVETPWGRLRGRTAGERGDVVTWQGVPYAAEPVGPLRFAAPQPHPTWSGIRDATEGGRAAPQTPGLWPAPLSIWLSARRGRSEDCLTLNVWAPATPAQAPRPVVVWVHGGSFTSGTGTLYDGARLAREGEVVVVTVNYRLGGLGFLDFADAVGNDPRFASNPGLRDQLAALGWVRDAIAAFGGAPGRVTVAGESAGSASVTALATAPAARGLLHGVIAQSGALTLTIDREDAARNARAVLDELNLSRERIDELWRRPASAIVEATARAQARRKGGLITRPWWDGDLLPASLPAAYEAFAPVPLLIGTNADEHRIFTRFRRDIMPLTRAALDTVLVESLGAEQAARVLAQYPADPRGLNDLGSDLVFRMPSVHLAERDRGGAPTWSYRLDLASRFFGLGAFHAIELMLLFPAPPRVERVLLGAPSEERLRLARRFREHWLHFVRHGRPGDDWPAYVTASSQAPSRATQVWNLVDSVEHDPHAARREAWAGRDVTIH